MSVLSRMRQQLRIAECHFSSKRIKRRLKYRIVFLNSLIFHFRSIHKLSYVVSDIAGYISVRGWSYTYERSCDDRKLQMRLQISYTHTSYMYISLVIRLATIVSTDIRFTISISNLNDHKLTIAIILIP